MRLSRTEAGQLFDDHTQGGEDKVLIPKPACLARFEELKNNESKATYAEFSTSQ